MHSFQKPILLLFLGILGIAHSASASSIAKDACAQLSGSGAGDEAGAGAGFIFEGDLYCNPVRALRYTNVSARGDYGRVVAINDDGSCVQSGMRYGGPMAPFGEELSIHLHGPLHLSRLAVYVPPSSNGIVPRPHSGPGRRPTPIHTGYVPSPGHVLEQIMDDAGVGTVRANDGGEEERFVVFRDYVGFKVPRLSDGREAVRGYRNGNGEEERGDWGVVARKMKMFVQAWIPGFVFPSFSSRKKGTEMENAGDGCSLHPDTSDTNSDDISSSDTVPPQTPFKRLSYYSAATQKAENLVFLGHHGWPGVYPGPWDHLFGRSLSYASTDGTDSAASPQVLADTVIPSAAEVVVMLGQKCEGVECGFVRPRSSRYHGFGGAEKIFLIEFSMPVDEKPGFDGDMPSIALLNAQIPRTSQYGPAKCSCQASGCGEFHVLEALARGSPYLRSALHAGHANARGGSIADYIPRPTDAARPMKLAVVFDARDDAVDILVLPEDAPFPDVLAPEAFDRWRRAAGTVSSLDIRSGKREMVKI